jgi:hypothetical protein
LPRGKARNAQKFWGKLLGKQPIGRPRSTDILEIEFLRM